MRRIIFAVALLTATTASAINTATHPIRIALLAPANRYLDRRDAQASEIIRSQVQNELRDLGYDVFTTNDDRPRADYSIDILGPGGGGYPVAEIGVPVGRGGIDFAVIVSHVAASVNVYDGRSFELLHTLDLHKKSTMVAPSAIAIGSRPFWAVIAVPFVEWAQSRSGVRAVAHDAARQIDEALRH
jgi:hypothetical protein